MEPDCELQTHEDHKPTKRARLTSKKAKTVDTRRKTSANKDEQSRSQQASEQRNLKERDCKESDKAGQLLQSQDVSDVKKTKKRHSASSKPQKSMTVTDTENLETIIAAPSQIVKDPKAMIAMKAPVQPTPQTGQTRRRRNTTNLSSIKLASESKQLITTVKERQIPVQISHSLSGNHIESAAALTLQGHETNMQPESNEALASRSADSAKKRTDCQNFVDVQPIFTEHAICQFPWQQGAGLSEATLPPSTDSVIGDGHNQSDQEKKRQHLSGGEEMTALVDVKQIVDQVTIQEPLQKAEEHELLEMLQFGPCSPTKSRWQKTIKPGKKIGTEPVSKLNAKDKTDDTVLESAQKLGHKENSGPLQTLQETEIKPEIKRRPTRRSLQLPEPSKPTQLSDQKIRLPKSAQGMLLSLCPLFLDCNVFHVPI